MDLKIIAKTNLLRKSDVENNGLRLEKLILNASKKNLNKINHGLKDPRLCIKLQRLYEKFETNLEIKHAKELIANSQKLLEKYLLYKRFVRLIKNEIELARITHNDKMLFIGSGPFPISAILFNQLTGCEVDCYEKEKNRAELSKKALLHLGFSQKIQVLNTNGENLNSKKYTVVVIALLAKPKDKILKRIYKISRKNTKIITRTADGKRKGFYEVVNRNIFNNFKFIRKVKAEGNQTISSVLLMK